MTEYLTKLIEGGGLWCLTTIIQLYRGRENH
jgi:hypothetical protein